MRCLPERLAGRDLAGLRAFTTRCCALRDQASATTASCVSGKQPCRQRIEAVENCAGEPARAGPVVAEHICRHSARRSSVHVSRVTCMQAARKWPPKSQSDGTSSSCLDNQLTLWCRGQILICGGASPWRAHAAQWHACARTSTQRGCSCAIAGAGPCTRAGAAGCGASEHSR